MTGVKERPVSGKPADVVIIGGGIAGLTLGCALGSAGATVALVEPLPAEQLTSAGFDGRTTAVAAGSQAVLAAIGAWPRMAANAQPILDIRVSDGHSPLYLHYDHRDLGGEALGYIVENRTIRITGRIAGGRESRNSPTRQAAGIETTAWRYKQIGIVCTVHHEIDHCGVAQEHFLPAGPFAILPMTGRRSSIVWTERADLAPALLALGDQEFLAELTLRFGDYLGKLEIVGPRFSYPLGFMYAQQYIASRLALAGDAAHAIHPIAGQGLNIGWRDVAALAEVVIDALRLGLDPGSMATLERYERWRRVDNAMMLAATDALNRLFSNDIAPVRLARGAGLAAVNGTPPLKRLFMRHAMGVLGDVPRLVRGEAL
jgi:2-octaprenyl-6-methoxyphenol hydroxylase